MTHRAFIPVYDRPISISPLDLSKKIVRDEVDNVPLSQIRKWDDVPKLAAFMYETIRWNPAVFRNLYHTATRQIECAGYMFSKDTLFSYNIAGQRSLLKHKVKMDGLLNPFSVGLRSGTNNFLLRNSVMISEKAVSMNEKYFPEPFKFDPNRFLTNDGNLKESFLHYVI